MSISRRILVRVLGQALRIQRLVPGPGNRIETFLGSVALAALDPVELARLTNRLFAARGTYRDRGLFPWETSWFAADLPPAPAKILLGGAGTGREAHHLVDQGYDLVAFDPVARFVDRARVTFAGTAAVTFLVGSYEDLIQPRSARAQLFAGQVESRTPYDAVLLGWASLTHLVEPETRLSVLARMRELCPSGPVLISFWATDDRDAPTQGNARSWGARLGSLLSRGLARPAALDDADYVLAHSGFGHRFSRPEIESLAQKAGYTVSRYEPSASTECFPHATLQPDR
jgi:hypothetical protein